MAEENSILAFQQELTKIAEMAKAKGDSFVFKCYRRFSQTTAPNSEQHILTFSGATVEQIANHELWLRSVTGGTQAGNLIAVIYPTGENVNHCAFFTIRYEGNIPQGGKLNLEAVSAPDWRGPQITHPLLKATPVIPGTTSAAPPPGTTPGGVTPSSGNGLGGGDRFSEERLQRLEAALRQAEEKAHLAELEKIRVEGDAKVREIAAEAKRDKAELAAQLRAIEARVSAPPVAVESPIKPLIDLAPLWVGMQERAAAKELEDRREARAEQQRRDDREAARLEAARLEAARLENIRREEQQRREDREREERKAAREEEQRREDRLEAQRREDREREDKREERMEAQRAEVLAQLREQQSGGALNGQVDLFANMAGKSMQMAAQLLEMQGPPAGEHPAVPIAREIAQIFKPFGSMPAKPATPARATEPAPAANQTVPTTATPAAAPATEPGKKLLIDEIVEMIRAHADPAKVAEKFVGQGRTDDALQKELLGPPADGDMRVLFVHHLGGDWLGVEENQVYVRQLLHAVLKYGIGYGIFKRELAAEYDVDIAELGLPNNGVTQGEMQQTPEQIAARRVQTAMQGVTGAN